MSDILSIKSKMIAELAKLGTSEAMAEIAKIVGSNETKVSKQSTQVRDDAAFESENSRLFDLSKRLACKISIDDLRNSFLKFNVNEGLRDSISKADVKAIFETMSSLAKDLYNFNCEELLVNSIGRKLTITAQDVVLNVIAATMQVQNDWAAQGQMLIKENLKAGKITNLRNFKALNGKAFAIYTWALKNVKSPVKSDKVKTQTTEKPKEVKVDFSPKGSGLKNLYEESKPQQIEILDESGKVQEVVEIKK
jgi:hypothetical protein